MNKIDQLIQKTLFGKRSIKVYESKFSYTIYNYGNESEIMIPFENVTKEKLSIKKTEIVYLIMAAFMAFITLISASSIIENEKEQADIFTVILLGLASILLLLLFIFKRDNLWRIYLSNGSNVTIYKNVPNKAAVDKFYEDLIITRDIYLIKNYASLDSNLNYDDQFKNLKWLKSIDVISNEEYEKKYLELQTFQKAKTKIGFV